MIRITATDIHEHDAVGNYCIDMAACLRGLGYCVILYANGYADGNPLGISPTPRLFTDIEAGDIIITHYSIFDPDLDAIAALPNRKICYFHGVTPPELLAAFEPVTADLCRRSQRQFAMLARFDRVFANSLYSADVLTPLLNGKAVTPLPPIFAARPLLSDNPSAAAKKTGGILMVGRIVPHKNIELALGIFAALRRHMPAAHLTIVGESTNADYPDFLRQRAAELGIAQAVTFTGKIGDDDLRRHYRSAGGFLCTSLHEGFCIPVLEAMRFDTPVFVRTGNAAAEVAEGAGILFSGDNAEAVGKSMADVLHDAALTIKLATAGRRRAQELLARNSPDFWAKTLQELAGKA